MATIMDKTVETFYQIYNYSGCITNFFNPRQCCKCFCVVKTKSDELRTPRNIIERGRGRIKYSLPACKARHSGKILNIRLS